MQKLEGWEDPKGYELIKYEFCEKRGWKETTKRVMSNGHIHFVFSEPGCKSKQ